MDFPEEFEFEVDGKTILAKRGQSIAEALLSNGIKKFRITQNNAPRGVYCGIGICYECRMIVNGAPNVRTCMTPAIPGCNVITQKDANIRTEE
jgi:predicted molibdopterin-dependent oxidoreductase YjgC